MLSFSAAPHNIIIYLKHICMLHLYACVSTWQMNEKYFSSHTHYRININPHIVINFPFILIPILHMNVLREQQYDEKVFAAALMIMDDDFLVGGCCYIYALGVHIYNSCFKMSFITFYLRVYLCGFSDTMSCIC